MFSVVFTTPDGRAIKQPISERLNSNNKSFVEVFNDAYTAVKGYEPFTGDHYVSLLSNFL